MEGFAPTDYGVVISWNSPDRCALVMPRGDGFHELVSSDSPNQSDPVACGHRVVFFEEDATARNRRRLRCLDLETGECVTLPVPVTGASSLPVWGSADLILTAAQTDGRWRLVAARPWPGSAVEPLAELGCMTSAPAIHAAGGAIVAVAERNGWPSVILLDGTAERVLVQGNRSAAPLFPRLSPDAEWLACTIRRRSGEQLLVMSLSGMSLSGGRSQVIDLPGPAGPAVWHPGGTSLVLPVSEWPESRIAAVDVATGELTPFGPAVAARSEGMYLANPQWFDGRWWVVGHDITQPPALFTAGEADPHLTRLTPGAPMLRDFRWKAHAVATPRNYDIPCIVIDPPILKGAPESGAGETDPPPTVVMLHGGPAAAWRLGWDPLITALLASGRRVVLAETSGSAFRGWPLPPVGPGQFGVAEPADVIALVDWLRPAAVSVFGHSYGAYVAYRVSALAPGLLRSLILTSGYLDPADLDASGDPAVRRFREYAFGPPGVPSATQLPASCPVLTVHGEHDEQAPLASAARNPERLAGAGHELRILPGDGHAFRRRDNVIAWFAHALDFLDRNHPVSPGLHGGVHEHAS